MKNFLKKHNKREKESKQKPYTYDYDGKILICKRSLGSISDMGIANVKY